MSNKLPKSVILELTYDCNHECKFCYCPWENKADNAPLYKKSRELTVEEWKIAIRRLMRCGVEQIGLSGGEPLIKDGFYEIVSYIRQSGYFPSRKLTIITNGDNMTPYHIDELKNLNVHISFSLPGLSTFAYHTGSETNSAEKVLQWIRRANEAGISTTINVTATAKNIHELYQIIANGFLAGADSLLLNRFLVGGRGTGYIDDLSLSKEQIVQMLDIAEEVLEDAGAYGYLGVEVPLCILPDTSKYKRLEFESTCGAARSFFTVDPEGYIRVCNHSPRRVGNILEPEIFGDISDKGYWDMFAERRYELPEMCAGCELREHCDCGCREAAAICCGSHDAPDPVFTVRS